MEKTSNVTVRLYEVVTPILAKLNPNEGTAFSEIMNSCMSPGSTPYQTVTLKNYLRLIELLSETMVFLESHTAAPPQYVAQITRFINFLNSNPPFTPMNTFSQNITGIDEAFFANLVFAFRDVKTEATIGELEGELQKLADEISNLIESDEISDELKEHINRLLFQLKTSVSAYRYGGNARLDEVINQFIAEMTKIALKDNENPKVMQMVGRILKQVSAVATYTVLSSDTLILTANIGAWLGGGD